MMTKFMPGLRLCKLFYEEAVQPILAARFPELNYSAARLDRGSDVLGFDTPQSRDHHWGPKTMLFVSETDYAAYAPRIEQVMAHELPFEIHGHPTHFDTPEIDGGSLKRITHYPITHGVTVTTSRRFFQEYLGFSPLDDIQEVSWLTTPPQLLRTIASGQVFYDGLDELLPTQRALAWYPQAVWLYLLACQWRRIAQEEPFMARCGHVGDELGSRLVAARLVNEVMRLCFLMEKQYAPYYKWFGTAFTRLSCAADLTPMFHSIFDSQTWPEREKYLSAAYIHLIHLHNQLGLTDPLKPEVSPFHSRPYLVPHADRFSAALYAQIQSETVKRWPRHIGAVGQFADSTDVLGYPDIFKTLGVVYRS